MSGKNRFLPAETQPWSEWWWWVNHACILHCVSKNRPKRLILYNLINVFNSLLPHTSWILCHLFYRFITLWTVLTVINKGCEFLTITLTINWHILDQHLISCHHSSCCPCSHSLLQTLLLQVYCATSWQYWHIVHYMGPLHSTWQASSRRHLRSLVVSTCDPLLNRNWSFHGAVGRRSAAGLFRWQVRQSGTHYRTVSETQSWL